MDKGWMSKNRLSQEYEDGVDYFLNFAIENGKDPNAMWCPCVKCGNLREKDVKTIKYNCKLRVIYDSKLVGLKSHDCHTLIQQLLPVAIRGVLPKQVRYDITRFCLFFNVLCNKVIDVSKLDDIQRDIIVTLCMLEKHFPPSFFDIMVHLTVHLVREVKLCGPVWYRWMYPFERFMRVLKGYVRNHNCPERCIAECYIAEEALELCSEYLSNIPKSLKLLHSYSKHALGDGCSIKILVDKDVFGDEEILYIFFDDIHNFCELNPVGASSICVYIWHLYKECVNTNLIDRFRFINPHPISHNPKVDSTEKASIVGKRLIGSLSNQLVFVPCNFGFHWILMVVDPHKEKVYVLDSLSNNYHFDEWIEEYYGNGYESVQHEHRKKGETKYFMGSYQVSTTAPDEKQCGFYVMRYMKDIIENCDSLPIPLLFSEGFYWKREIDEVRTEWCGVVQDFID